MSAPLDLALSARPVPVPDYRGAWEAMVAHLDFAALTTCIDGATEPQRARAEAYGAVRRVLNQVAAKHGIGGVR